MFVSNNRIAAVAAAHRIDPDRWRGAFTGVLDVIESRFARYEPLRHAAGLQHLLARASWDADAVRDDLRGYVATAFGDEQAVLVVDETGDLKKGSQSVGVQRQYTGTAGRIENAQVAVYLNYAAPRGHALIDRALYVPKSWAGDQGRREQAGMPEEVAFATKPALAAAMIERAVQAGTPAAWVAGDEVYGADPRLRAKVRELGLGYVLQVAANRRVRTHAGPMRVDAIAALLADDQPWQTYSCGRGAKGHRDYAWAWAAILPDPGDADPDGVTGTHHLLIRRTRSSGELAHLRCWTPRPTSLVQLVRVAGQRWRIEESFQSAKGLVGLDQHQVRRWTSWHRWTTLAMLAHAFLAVATATERDHAPTPDGLIELTVNEFRRLFDAVLSDQRPSAAALLSWSSWRRRHQYRAQLSHYRRQDQQQ